MAERAGIVDTNVDTLEPSGSNDVLFSRTMAGIQEQERSRSLDYRRRAALASVAFAAFVLILTISLVIVFGA